MNAVGTLMDEMIERYIQVDSLKELLKQSIQDKQAERTTWADLTQSCHRMFRGNSEHLDQLCALTEIIILALDIMDDLQDQDNHTKVWMSWTQSASMNVFLALLMTAFVDLEHTLRSTGRSEVRQGEICDYILRAIHGQHMDTENEIQTEEDYVTSVVLKSGSLIRLAFYMGYASAGLEDAETKQKMDQLADYVGIMAQLGNDLRDVLRYDIKNDLLNCKKTLPILYLLQYSEQDFPLLKRYYEGECSKDEFLANKVACLQYIENSGCIEYTKVIQALYYQKADEILNSIDADPETKQKLKEAAYASYGVETTD